MTDREASVLVALARGRRVMEFGSAYGFSTVTMALVAKQVVSVDPHTGLPGSLERWWWNVHAYAVADRVVLVHGTSTQACAVVQGRFGMVLVDGAHDRRSAGLDIACARDRLEWRGTISVHDYGRLGAVTAAVDESGMELVGVADTLALLRQG